MFTQLKNLVSNNLDNDNIAKCYLNTKVKKVCDCGNTFMFQTENGKLFEVYKTSLK